MPGLFSTLAQPVFDEAIKTNQLAKVSLALKLGADPNFSIAAPPLHKACAEGNVALVSLLLGAKANVNGKDTDGDTPLISALRGSASAKDATSRAQEKAPSNEMLEGTATETAKAWKPAPLGQAPEPSLDSTTTWVLDGGGNIADRAGRRGQLRLPATTPEIVSMLVSAGANVNYSTTSGKIFRQTALMLAAQHGNLAAIRTLLKSGANVNAIDSDGDTVLMYAAAEELPNVVTLLLAARPDKNVQNSAGFTAAHYAVQYNRAKTLSLLMAAGADMGIRNKQGLTPAELAITSRSIAAAKVIVEAMQSGGPTAPNPEVSMWFQAPLQKAPDPAAENKTTG